jgi:multidrug efflux pump subunit AcrB
VAVLARTGGAKDIDRDDKPGKDQVRVEIDHERLARVGATVADVAQNARIALDGEVATSVRYGDEDVDFRVRLVDEARGDLRYVERLVIPNARGRLITLGDVANLQRSPGPGSYSHYDGERAITVTSDYVKDATTPTKIASAVVDHFDMENDWPGMRLVIGGEAQEMDESMQSLFRAFIIAVIGIYFILVLLFNSTAQPLVVLAAVPFGVMGVIWAFALHGMQLGFLAMMGTVGLCGVVVNDSLVLVNHINDLRRRSTGTDLREVVATASADRLRPVLLTSFTTIVGVTPLVYGIGGSDPFIVPMVLALGYGVMFATPLTLAMIPCLYFVGEDLKGLPRRLGRVFRRVDVPARHA